VDTKQLDRSIFDKWSAGKKAELKPSDFGWTQDTKPWKTELKSDAASDQPFVYRAEGKYISFKPTGLWWVTPLGTSVISQGVSLSIGNMADGKVTYANALGAGIGLEAPVSQTTWRKLVTIESLAALGSIPANAEVLEIGFEIETDFDIEGWDKKSDFQFDTAVKLSELSKLESIKAWDNHITPEHKEVEEPENHFKRCSGSLRVLDGKAYLVKQIPVEYLKQAVYPVIADTTITYGSEYPFNAADTTFISCATLMDLSYFVVAFSDGGDSGHGKAMIGIISSGDEIAYGDPYEFNAAASSAISCTALDATHFVVGYSDGGDLGHGKAMIGVVSGDPLDDIAYGDPYEFHGAATDNISCAALDDTHFVVGYRDTGDDNFGESKIGVVSLEDEIAYGSEYPFNAAVTDNISCAALDATDFVVGFKDDGDADFGIAMIGVVSLDDEIAYGLEYPFNEAASSAISCAALTATRFVVGYSDGGDLGHGKAKIGNVSSGDNISYGDPYEFNAAATTNISCTALGGINFIVAYTDDGGDDYGIARRGKVGSGDEITYDDGENPFNEAVTDNVSCIAIAGAYILVAYRDDGGDDYGESKVGYIEPDCLYLAQYSGEYTCETHWSSNWYLNVVTSGDITYDYGFGLVESRVCLYSYISGYQVDLMGKIADAIAASGG